MEIRDLTEGARVVTSGGLTVLALADAVEVSQRVSAVHLRVIEGPAEMVGKEYRTDLPSCMTVEEDRPMWCAECLNDLIKAGLLQREGWFAIAQEETDVALTVHGGQALCRRHLLAVLA